MRSTRTAVTPPPPPVTMTPAWSTSALGIRTMSTLRTGNLQLSPVGGIGEAKDVPSLVIQVSLYTNTINVAALLRNDTFKIQDNFFLI